MWPFINMLYGRPINDSTLNEFIEFCIVNDGKDDPGFNKVKKDLKKAMDMSDIFHEFQDLTLELCHADDALFQAGIKLGLFYAEYLSRVDHAPKT